MARHRDAEKKQRQNVKHRSRNRNYMAALKESLAKGRSAAASREAKGVAASIKAIGKTASAGVIHKRKASRLISRLARLQNRSAKS